VEGHEAIVRDAEINALRDSRDDVCTRSATLMTLVGTIEIRPSQLVASRWNQIDHARVIAISQRITRSQVEQTMTPQRASPVDNTSQSWER
jgi:hypothetical protein